MGKKCVQTVHGLGITLGISRAFSQPLNSSAEHVCTKSIHPHNYQQAIHSTLARDLIWYLGRFYTVSTGPIITICLLIKKPLTIAA